MYGSLTEFLLDSRVVIDITSNSTTNPSCGSGYDFERNRVCTRTVFLPGTVAEVVDEHYHEADLVIVHDNVGYQLDFDPLEDGFNFEAVTHCRIYGTEQAAAQFCFAPAAQGCIAAKVTSCYTAGSDNQSCLKSTQWKNNPGISTLLTIQLRTADVAYTRRTGAIATHSFQGGPSPTSISWYDLQEAHHAILTGNGTLQAAGDFLDIGSADNSGLDDSGLDDILDTFGNILGNSDLDTNTMPDASSDIFDTSTSIFQYNKVSLLIPSALYAVNITFPSTTQQSFAGSSILHNILAIPIYRSSSSSWQSIDPSQLGTATALDGFAGPTNLSLAESKYTLSVGLWSVVVYAVVGTLLILFCFTTLVLATFHASSSQLPDYGPYPLFDFWRWLTVTPGDDITPNAVSGVTEPPPNLKVQLSK
ncbi:hypothetical protein LTR67_011307 [Exophiala xenobiotica]